MKQFNLTAKISIALGDWDGVCSNFKSKENNDIYSEVWVGKAKYTYPHDGTCTMYVFGFFRILVFDYENNS